MNMIEEVKKIIRKGRTGVTVTRNECANFINYPTSVAELAKKINQLYEPQPDQSRVCPAVECSDCPTPGIYTSTACEECWLGKMVKSGQSSRLLTEEKIINITGCPPFDSTYSPAPNEVAFSINSVKKLLEAQLAKDDVRIRALINSIGNSYWRERLKRENLKANPTSEVEG